MRAPLAVALLALAPPVVPQAAAQTETTKYVSNIGQSQGGRFNGRGTFGQPFTTGSDTNGYIVTRVDIVSRDSAGDSFTLSVCSTNASGHPTDDCTALTSPDSFAAGTLTFTAPAAPEINLLPDTTYAIFKAASSDSVWFGTTRNGGEDDDGSEDWSIGNDYVYQSGSATWFTLSGTALRIAIYGRSGVAVATVDSVEVTSTPLLTLPGSSSPDTYGAGETIEFTATFSEAVAVTGDPEFAFLVGKTVRRAAYDSAASTDTELVFRYTVESVDRAAGGISVGAFPQPRVFGRVGTFMLDAGDRIVTVSSSADAFLGHDALGTLLRHKVGVPVPATVAWAAPTSTPRLTSTGGSAPDTYGRGETIEFTVAFDRDVTVPGRPEFEFALGDGTRQALYDPGASTARALVFRYTVRAGDVDSDGIRVAGRATAFNLDGDHFVVADGVQANLDHAEMGTLSAHKVDATRTLAATVSSVAVTSTPPSTSVGGDVPDTYGNGDTIEFTVTFSEAVEVRGRPQFQFALEDSQTDRRLADYDAAASTATALVFGYVVRPGDVSGADGLLLLPGVTAFEGIIAGGDVPIVTVSSGMDAALDYSASGRESGHKVVGDPAPTASIAPDGVRVTSTPTLRSARSTVADTYVAGDTIEFTVTFTAPVTVTGDPEFEFSMDTARRAVYVVEDSTPTVLKFRYVVVVADEDDNGIWVGDQTRTLKLGAGDAIAAAFGGILADHDHRALNTLSGHKVDGDGVDTATIVTDGVQVTSTPMLRSLGSTVADTYGRDEAIEFTVTFDRDVTVTGDPEFEFAMRSAGAPDNIVTTRRRAAYVAADSTPTVLKFRYVVLAADRDNNGIWVGDQTRTFKLDADDAILTTSSNADAILNHRSLNALSGHKVDGGAVATASIVTNGVQVTSTPTLSDTYIAGDTIEFTVTFTEAVTVTGDPELEFVLLDSGAPFGDSARRRAAYAAADSTPTVLKFRYVVAAADRDNNGIWAGDGSATFQLDADDAIVTTSNNVPAILTHRQIGALTGHKVDGSAVATASIVNNRVAVTSTPKLMSSGSSGADTYGRGETMEFTVTFTEAVTVTGDPEFEFVMLDSGAPFGDFARRRAAYAAAASTSTVLKFRYVVAAEDRDNNGIWAGDGSATFQLDADDAIVTTSNNVPAILTHRRLGTPSGTRVDGSAAAPASIVNNRVAVTSTPKLMSSGSSGADTYGLGETIEFTVTFTEAVTVTGDPEFEFVLLDSGAPFGDSARRRAAYAAADSTPTVLRFRYVVVAADRDNNGIWAGNGSATFQLDADDAIVTTSNDADADLTHGQIGALRGHKVDGSTAAPARIVDNRVEVTSTPKLMSSGSTQADTYGLGETIEFTVTFTEAVTVTGDPEFEFSVRATGVPDDASTRRRAAYAAAASTPTVLKFRYVVVAADMDDDGIWIGSHIGTFQLDADDAIVTTSGNADADLFHSLVGRLSGHKVDGSAVDTARIVDNGVEVTSTPLLMSSGSPVADTYGAGETIELTVTFTEAVTVTGDPELEFNLGSPGAPVVDTVRRAAYAAADSTPTVLKFRYQVLATDRDSDGIRVGTRAFVLDADDAIVRTSDTVAADLDHDALGPLSAHKVGMTTPPSAPSLTATPGDGQVTLTWSAPGDGGSPITGYYYRHGAGATVPDSVRWTGAAASPITVTGLANGTQYAFEVRAVNPLGVGPRGATTATPVAQPACDMPSLSGRHVIWSAVLDVARIDRAPSGYGFDAAVPAGSLPAPAFSVGTTPYAIAAVQVNDGGTGDGNLVVRLDAQSLTTADRDRLTLHLCDTPYRFEDATPTPATHAYEWTASLDWSTTRVRELRLTVPSGTAATGKPSISGPSTKVGARVRAVTTAIADLDGLPESFAYRWVRVDADGTSNPVHIEGATGEEYVVGAGDAGKRLQVVVSFTDARGMSETLTSDPWPPGDSIMANQPPVSADTAVTIVEDAMYTFTAGNFAFTDGDADTFAGVRIVEVPRAGLLALDGAPVGPGTMVTRARLDAAGLTFRPTANGHGTGFARFTFRVSDGHAESGAANTLTVHVTPVNDAPTGRPAITLIGSVPRVGRELTASPGDLADVDGLPDALDWQWVRVDGGTETNIAAATAMTYTPVAADQGKQLKVKALFTDDDGTAETVPSAATVAVAAATSGAANATGQPRRVRGVAVQGSEVEFTHSGVNDPDGLDRSLIRLQWLRCNSRGNNCDTVIAEGDTYTLTAADVGRRLRVRAVFADNDDNLESRQSSPWPATSDGPIIAYPPCDPAYIGSLEGESRRVIFSATLTVGSGRTGQYSTGTGYFLQTFGFPGIGAFSGFGSFSPSPAEFTSGSYRFRLDRLIRIGPEVNVPDSFISREGNFEVRLAYLNTGSSTGNTHLRQKVLLHVCNQTLSFAATRFTTSFQGGHDYEWAQPGVSLWPGTTVLVRVSERAPDADLRDLHLKRRIGDAGGSGVPLSPVFVPEKTDYTAEVEEAVTRVSVLAEPNDPRATLRYLRRTDADSASPGTFEVDLALGDNDVDIEVTGRDGTRSGKKTYTMRVTRNLSDDATLSSLALSRGTLAPAFSPAHTSYAATVEPTGLPSVTVTAQTNHPAASFEYLDGDDAPLADADPASPDTFEVDLPVGDTVIKLKVTAQDGATTRTYTTTITREVSTDASLKTLALSRGTLDPVFSPAHTSYTTTVGVSTETRVTVTAEPTYPNATFEHLAADDTVLADADPASPDTFEVDLTEGENVVKVKVTAEDGTTTREYTVTITAVVVTEVSIAAVHSEAAPGLALPAFTVTAADAPATDLEVTLTFTQDAAYVTQTTQAVTIAAGDTSVTEKFALSTDLTLPSGDLTATVTGGGIAYAPAPAPRNAATVEVVVTDPLLTAVWDEDAYTVEEGESVTVEARLRTADGVPRPREEYAVAVSALDGTAVAGTEYTAVPDTTFTVAPGDWAADGAAFTETLSLEVETIEDAVLDGNKTLHVRLAAASGYLAPGLDCPAELADLGTDSLTSCATEVTIDDDETLSVTGVTVTSTPATGDTYLGGEVIGLTAGFTAAVTVATTDGTPALAFTLGDATKTAAYASGSASDALVFSYTVVEGDVDRDGISWEADAITLEGGTIRLTTEDPNLVVDADLEHAAGAAQGAHKVDAKAPVLQLATYQGTEMRLRYDEALDGASAPATGQYTLAMAGATPPAVSAVSVSATTVRLTLSAEPPEGVKLSYAYDSTDPDHAPVQDVVGNDAATFTNETVQRGEQLRLVDGGTANEGRLEIRLEGRWGTICDDYWTDRHADLACRLLGYPEGSTGNGGRFHEAYFGEGTGPIWLDDMRCRGDEARLSECRRRGAPDAPERAIGEHDCTHQEDVGVQCRVAESVVPGVGPGKPGIGGTARVGRSLSASRGDIADVQGLPEGAFPEGYTFQWQRVDGGTDTDISGATGRDYTLAAADEGKRVRVKVRFVDRAGNPETRTSDAWPASGTVEAASTDPVPARGPGAQGSFSVADAEVDEGPGARLDFVVTLSEAQPGTVGVYHETRRGTATPGPSREDYEEGRHAGSDCASGRYAARHGADYVPLRKDLLVFPRGVTVRTVSVDVCEDVVNDDGETVKLVLLEPVPRLEVERTEDGEVVLYDGLPRWLRPTIADGEATGTIRNDDPIPRAWLARFGRTVAEQVLEAAEGRLAGGRGAGVEVRVAGLPLGAASPEQLEAFEAREAGARATARSAWLAGGTDDEGQALRSLAFTGRDLLTGSAVTLTGGTAQTGFASFWGRGAVSRFDGREDALSLDGEVGSAMLGADFARERTTLGLMLAHSRGAGGYASPEGRGEVESELTGLYPYGRHAWSERLELWGVAGYGAGELTLTPESWEPVETDMDLVMGAVGVRGVALEAPVEGGAELAVEADALGVLTRAQATPAFVSEEADVTRLRLALVGTWRGDTLVPTLELGVRHDGGDAESGFGLDAGAGLSWSHPRSGLSGELRVRGLLTHESEGFRDRGVSGSLDFDARPESERGFALTLSQTMGAASSGGAHALFGHRHLGGFAAGDGGGGLERRQLRLTAGYGIGVLGDRFTWTPQARLGLAETGGDYALGWRLARRPSGGIGSLELSFEALWREGAGDDTPPERTVGVRLTGYW